MNLDSTYFHGHRCPVLDDYLSIHNETKVTEAVLRSWVDGQNRPRNGRRRSRRRSRDRWLAYELEELRDMVEDSVLTEQNEHSFPDPEQMALDEKLLYFLEWRNQLQILHSSIGRSLDIAKRMRDVYSRTEIRSLQKIQDDLTDYLYETNYLQQKAREKLNEIWTAPPQTRRSGNDSGYQSPRVSTPPRNHSNKYLAGVLKEAEKIKAESTEASLKLEYEVERLKAKSIDMAKDLVALNKVIECQKKELVELTRQKRNNEMAEKELELEGENAY